MAMREDFCAFILTHGRPDRVHTYKTLQRAGYTGKVFIVIDDEDKTADEYRARFGDKVLQFCKADMDASLDPGDNFEGRTSTIWPRNALWGLARQVGCKYFIQLDDDYTNFEFTCNSKWEWRYLPITRLDEVFELLVDFGRKARLNAVALAQGGDFVGGRLNIQNLHLRRKAMNTFVCSVDRPFRFFGRMNEDVNTYVCEGRRGRLFFTLLQAKIVQVATQSSSGGMSELYLDAGTYVKTFYTVMYAPSCVQVGMMGDPRGKHYRIHHKINWHKTAPKILREEWRKASKK